MSQARPNEDQRQRTNAAVFGGGGLFGIGFTLGVTEALVDAGHNIAAMPAVGTSAGSWAAAGLALHVRFLDALDLLGRRMPRLPDPRPGRLGRVAAELFGEHTRVPSLRVVACAVPWLRRVVLPGADWPVADLVAASSAVPGLLAPQRIGGVRYIDGGVRSMASIDLADPADRLLVVLPLATSMFGPATALVECQIRREIKIWRAANPRCEVIVVRPTPSVAALARGPHQLFDVRRARRCYELAYAIGYDLRSRWGY